MTRNECVDGERPCCNLSCSWHVFWVLHSYAPSRVKGTYTYTADEILNKFSDRVIVNMIGKMPETCVLDVCDKGPLTLEAVALSLGVTRERIRQIEDRAIRRLRYLKTARALSVGLIDDEEIGAPKKKRSGYRQRLTTKRHRDCVGLGRETTQPPSPALNGLFRPGRGRKVVMLQDGLSIG